MMYGGKRPGQTVFEVVNTGSYSDLPKNDDVDAFVIADKLRFGRITKEVYMDDYRCKALQTLTRTRFYAVQDLTREKQRFANYLF